MSDDKERQMIENAKRAEKAAGPKTMDKPADNPVSADNKVASEPSEDDKRPFSAK